MPKLENVKKVLVIGSGPIIIGQAAEFDYSGTQACRSLREEGLEVVLVNSNPATIMTDTHIADRVYVEPLTVEFLESVIRKEHPDAMLATLGGQVGLNLAMELDEKGILRTYGVKLLGTQIETIQRAEDRELFKEAMEKIHQPIPESTIVETVAAAKEFAHAVGYPLIVRPAYTLGGTGGGIAQNDEELDDIVTKGLTYSLIGQALIERSVAGWKEIEYEVLRDADNNCITVCNMENVDPVGVHTGDSVVVAPCQTLSDREVQMLRQASIDIVRELGVCGACNVQLALDPYSEQYYVIEVNPRVSRSSALASKATGYPIAKVAAKIAAGYTLDEIRNAVTQKTTACFEPTLDYLVVKFPRWPFDKFVTADRTLGTQMKATGEVMAIERTFEAGLLKAARCLEIGCRHLELKKLKTLPTEEIRARVGRQDDERLFSIAEYMRRGGSVEEIHAITKINEWFLKKIQNIVAMEDRLRQEPLTEELLRQAKRMGFADEVIAAYGGTTWQEIRAQRKAWHILPTYKMVDTCAAEFEAATPYYYSTYASEDEVAVSDRKKVCILGSGPIRIGQGVEFDYSTVHAVMTIKKAGYEAIIINNNPETVSTDYTTADKLYFEPLTPEDVMNIIDFEKPDGVIASLGGQTAINLAQPLHDRGVKIIGTGCEAIDRAENRDAFEKLLKELDIPQPKGRAVTKIEDGLAAANEIGYPVLVRPSFVLGGRAMQIVANETQLRRYLKSAVEIDEDKPVLVDKYIQGREVEIDAICDGRDVFVPGIMELVERTGVHSGDSISVYPSFSISDKVKGIILQYAKKLGLGIGIVGLFNVQFIVDPEDNVSVIEVNPRSSRTVPFLSKATGYSLADIATDVILGLSLKEQGFFDIYPAEKERWYVKAPVFSFNKIRGLDAYLTPEMKSTGEAIGYDRTMTRALYKALQASGMKLQNYGTVLATIADRDKEEALPLIRRFYRLGFNIEATAGTATFLKENGIRTHVLGKISDGSDEIPNALRQGHIAYVINTRDPGSSGRDGIKIRRIATEHNVTLFTALDTIRVLLDVLEETTLTISTIDA